MTVEGGNSFESWGKQNIDRKQPVCMFLVHTYSCRSIFLGSTHPMHQVHFHLDEFMLALDTIHIPVKQNGIPSP